MYSAVSHGRLARLEPGGVLQGERGERNRLLSRRVGIRQEATWLLIPFVPESFGISQQSDHLVFGYLYREKQQINSNHTLPIIFLLEDYTACKSLHIRIKTHFLINSNN